MSAPPYIPADAAINELCASGDLDAVINLFSDNRLRTPEFGRQGLLGAARKGQTQVARYLLDNGASIDNSVAATAARAKSLPIFELFVEYGWDVNSSILLGDTVLPIVIDDEELVRWLLDHGADPNRGPSLFPNASIPYVTDSGEALNAAAIRASIPIVDLLLRYGAKLANSVALHLAAGSEHSGRVLMMEHLIQLGVDVNGLDDKRGPYAIGPPLFYAIKNGIVENVRFLLENGANPLVRNREGRTAVEETEQTASIQLIELLKVSRAQN